MGFSVTAGYKSPESLPPGGEGLPVSNGGVEVSIEG
jgi:hypothetical protein